jgi:hypothetical protein
MDDWGVAGAVAKGNIAVMLLQEPSMSAATAQIRSAFFMGTSSAMF